MLGRDPDAIIVSHSMDPLRRELYVEGTRDRALINWIMDTKIGFHSSVVPIHLVKVPHVEFGGNRERLKRFLIEVAPAQKNIRGLIDADQSRITNEDPPSNAWITELRDAEGYVMTEENIDTALRLGLGIEKVSAKALMLSLFSVTRYISAVRLASHLNNFKLPISDCELKRYCGATQTGNLSIDADRFLKAMMQSADIGLSELERVRASVDEAAAKLQAIADAEI